MPPIAAFRHASTHEAGVRAWVAEKKKRIAIYPAAANRLPMEQGFAAAG